VYSTSRIQDVATFHNAIQGKKSKAQCIKNGIQGSFEEIRVAYLSISTRDLSFLPVGEV